MNPFYFDPPVLDDSNLPFLITLFTKGKFAQVDDAIHLKNADEYVFKR